MSNILYVTYDFSEGEDEEILMVGAGTVDDKMIILNTFVGEDAEYIWNLLIGEEGVAN